MRKSLAPLVLAGLFAVACTPQTVLRRSAFVPSPSPPEFSSRVVDKGHIEVTGAVSPYMGINQKIAKIGDPGLYAPTTQVQGSLRFGLFEHLDLGFHFNHGAWATSQQSAFGVPPIPDGRDLFGFGLGLRAGWQWGPWRLGVSLDFTVQTVPYASWVCQNCPSSASTKPASKPAHTGIFYQDGTLTYELADQGREKFSLYRVGAVLGYDLGFLLPFFSLSGMGSIENIGFDNSPFAGSTLRGGDPFIMASVGVEARIKKIVRLLAQAVLPLGTGPVAYFPGFMLSVGLTVF